MGRYTKHNSNYIKANIHQKLKDGATIFERDWVTIGSQLHFGPGKIPYYTNGNFIFTTSPIPYYQKRYKNGVSVGLWDYDDVKDATNVVNKVNDDEYTEDIRTYAYYGSCVELVRSSIEHIIETFPGNITATSTTWNIDGETQTYYLVDNQFNIILNQKNLSLREEDNNLRYLSYSWKKYEISKDGGETFVDIDNYEIDTKPFDKCKNNYIVYTVTINGNIKIHGCYYNGETIQLAESDKIVIQPKEKFIEEYFQNLKGFEKQLLARKSNPLYSNMFVTPIEYNQGYFYYKRSYTWPSNGYCIDITSTVYMDFISKLSSMAEIYDELWTNNLWNRMTHEAIKNYDWTYTKEFEDGEEQDNIDGGERMHKVINIIGRAADDIKRNIDLIKKNNTVTYNGDRNIPNALLSDKLDLMGWDVYSTIPTYTVEKTNDDDEAIKIEVPASDVKIDDEFLDEYGINWYETKNSNELTYTDVDINFMRKMVLSSKYILKTKGTRNAIDFIMGMFGYGLNDNDYTITETYRKVKPKMYDYSEYVEEESFGDKIVRLNAFKENERIYIDDEVSGIPVGSFKVQTNIDDECVFNTYLIPYYDQTKIYDGNFTFQSNGGWFYFEKLPYYISKNNPSDMIFSKEAYNTLPAGEKENYAVAYINYNDTKDVITEDSYNALTNEEKDNYGTKDEGVHFKTEAFNWTETLSYLHVVSTVEDLLNVNPNSVFNGDVYYVVNVNDYIDYTEEDTLKSNFFVLKNDFAPDIFSSWENIDLKDSDSIDAQKAKYLDSIILDTLGNNPHVGFGRYDKGGEYFEYMRKPFKFAIDKNFFNYDDKVEAEGIEFDVDKEDTVANNSSDKIKIFADQKDIDDDGDFNVDNKKLTTTRYINIYKNEKSLTEEEYNKKLPYYINKNDASDMIFSKEAYDDLPADEKENYAVAYINYNNTEDVITEDSYETLDEEEKNNYGTNEKISEQKKAYRKYTEYNKGTVSEIKRNIYYLNNKIVYFKNNIDNEQYKKYFKKVIMKYLMQVIPSTTILILQNFE